MTIFKIMNIIFQIVKFNILADSIFILMIKFKK
jgi:hypothetical protein